MSNNNITPFEATHPGILLQDELKARNIKQRELAYELGVLPTFLNEIIKGKRSITADFAVLLEKVLEIPADYWLRFQTQHDIDKARIKEKNVRKIELIEIWNIIKEYVPVKSFKKLGYLHSSSEIETNIKTIMKIYDTRNIKGLINVFGTRKKLLFYRKSKKLNLDKVNMIGWNILAEYEAKQINISKFKKENLNNLKKELQIIFFKNQNVKVRTKEKLAEYGIKLLYLQKFDKTPIDGYSFWSDKNPAIALTLRHKRIDNFAFTIFHEIGHIELHIESQKERKFIDLYGSKVENELESQADKYAQESLISEEQWNDLVNNYIPPNDNKIRDFGEKHKINPAIILGRICWEKNDYTIRSNIDKSVN
ncbi:MAG: HigA family addiction module antidote protein [Bacteroidales bacterium]|nr:HigA family addiction module antidote protein [Bacteroidales bacterium]